MTRAMSDYTVVVKQDGGGVGNTRSAFVSGFGDGEREHDVLVYRRLREVWAILTRSRPMGETNNFSVDE